MKRGLHRQAARVAFAFGLSGVIVGVGAAPALAATPTVAVSSGGHSVTDGQTLTSTGTLAASGSEAGNTTALTGTHQLTLSLDFAGFSSPRQLAAGASVARTQTATVSGSVDMHCAPWFSGCKNAANGTYNFIVSNGSSSTTSAVTLAVAPSDVTGFAASASGSIATFAWDANTDAVPDFAGYAIDNGSSTVTIQAGSGACDSSGCGVSVDYGQAARGQTYTFSIRALRQRAPGSQSTIASPNPATATVTFPTPPSPSPSTSDSSGTGTGGTDGSTGGTGTGGTDGSTGGTGTGGTDGSTGGSTTGTGSGSTSASGPVITGRHPSADLNHFLPLTSAGAAPNLPSVVTEIRPLPEGTYAPTLPYGDQSVTNAIKDSTPGSSTAISTEIERVLNLGPLWRSLAGAAVLLLVTAHLRAWLARIDTGE